MRDTDYERVVWLPPWVSVGSGAADLESELYAEIGTGHPLHGKRVKAVARRVDTDDVLFAAMPPSTEVAIVHLTWANHPEQNPKWPCVTLFSNFEEWIAQGRNADYREYGT